MRAPHRLTSALTRLSGRWPEMLVLLVSATAALTMLVGHSSTTAWVALCISTSRSSGGSVAGTLSAAWHTGALTDAASDWLLMTFAMVPVLSLPMIRFVAVRSFARRRARAVTEFLFGLLAVWTLAGVALIPLIVLSAVLGPPHEVTAPLAFGAAALWQMSAIKRLALRRCHQTVALRASGWHADVDCVVFALRVAVQCVISCWVLMFAGSLVSHSPVALAFILATAIQERAVHTPKLSRSASLLAVFAVVLALPLARATVT